LFANGRDNTLRSLRRLLLILLVTPALAYLAACLLLYVFQRSLIYFPPALPAGVLRATTTLEVPDASLRLSARPVSGPNALIYFGGNAEDVSLSLAGFSEAFPDHAIYMLHYRGYGGSSGTPSEAALESDAQSLFDTVRAEHPSVVVVGRSLGSGIALHLATTRSINRLVLVTPYDSIQNLAQRQFPYFPVGLLLKDKFESWRYAPLVKVPTLLVVAGSDEVIPRDSTEALFNSFQIGIATMKIIANVGHNSISDSPEYMGLLKGIP